MGVSRDEAREIAITALLIVTVLRIGSGFVQAAEELTRSWTWSSLFGRLLAPVGSTMGLFAFGAALLAALSPTGSVSMAVMSRCKTVAGVVAVLGLASVLNSFTSGLTVSLSHVLGRIWFAMINGFAAAVLGAAGWWILTQLDPER